MDQDSAHMVAASKVPMLKPENGNAPPITKLVEESLKKADVEIAQESSLKREGEELEQESSKKQKVDEDKETVELQSLIEIVPDEEKVAIDAIPLATKSPSIGRIVEIKRLFDDLRVTAAKVCVTVAKLNYVPWASRFPRFLDNKQEEGERMWRSIDIGPYKRKMIPNKEMLKPINKMTESNKKQYLVVIKVMNYILKRIPSDIYNSVDACKDANLCGKRSKRLMHCSEITKQERHSRLMNEFDKFVAMKGESLGSVYERLTTLVNVMDWNNIHAKADVEPKYDSGAISEVNASQVNLISGTLFKGVHEHTNHEKIKTVINTSVADQIDSNIIFDDSYVENNGGTDDHDLNVHD
ncbi:hypothetical protein Tco_0313955 [Tanacetum coccineum]